MGHRQTKSQPEKAEVHQFGVLNVVKIWRIGKHSIQPYAGKINIASGTSLQPGAPLFGSISDRACKPSLDSFARHADLAVATIVQSGLERVRAVILRAKILFDEMSEATCPHFGETQQVVLALDEPDREAMHAEYVLALECIGVVATQHVLVAEKIRKDRQQRFPFRRSWHGENLPEQESQT